MNKFEWINIEVENGIVEKGAIAIPIIYENSSYLLQLDTGSPVSNCNKIKEKETLSFTLNKQEYHLLFHPISKKGEYKYFGLLGNDFLSQFGFFIDLKGCIFKLNNITSFKFKQFYQFEYINNYIYILEMIGGIEVKLLFDTGASSKHICLDKSFLNKNDIHSITLSKIISKGFNDIIILSETVKLDNSEVIEVLTFESDENYLYKHLKCDGIIGLKFFNKICIDYNNKIIHYEKNSISSNNNVK